VGVPPAGRTDVETQSDERAGAWIRYAVDPADPELSRRRDGQARQEADLSTERDHAARLRRVRGKATVGTRIGRRDPGRTRPDIRIREARRRDDRERRHHARVVDVEPAAVDAVPVRVLVR
jgi:hypothetical protein